MPTFFVTSDAITPPFVRVAGSLLKHLRDSLRLRLGDTLTLTDEQGHRYRTEITAVTKQDLACRILETIQAPKRTSPSLVLLQALLKGEKMDWVVQKATELGVDRIVPIQAIHSVVKIHPDRTEHQRARWERIAFEAAQQSERWSVPSVAAPTDLTKAFAAYFTAEKFVLAERATEASLCSTPLPSGPDQTLLLSIGPEGGWDESELRFLKEQGCRSLTLGPRILRAETAAIAALSIVQSRLGELG